MVQQQFYANILQQTNLFTGMISNQINEFCRKRSLSPTVKSSLRNKILRKEVESDMEEIKVE